MKLSKDLITVINEKYSKDLQTDIIKNYYTKVLEQIKDNITHINKLIDEFDIVELTATNDSITEYVSIIRLQKETEPVYSITIKLKSERSFIYIDIIYRKDRTSVDIMKTINEKEKDLFKEYLK